MTNSAASTRSVTDKQGYTMQATYEPADSKHVLGSISNDLANVSIYLDTTKHLEELIRATDAACRDEPMTLSPELVRDMRFSQHANVLSRQCNCYDRDHMVSDDDVSITVRWPQLVQLFQCAIDCYQDCDASSD